MIQTVLTYSLKIFVFLMEYMNSESKGVRESKNVLTTVYIGNSILNFPTVK